MFEVERFLQETVKALLFGFLGVVFDAAGHEDDGLFGVDCLHALENVVAAHGAHLAIGEDVVVVTELVQGTFEVAHRAAGDGLVPDAAQHIVDDGEQGVVVVDDQDVKALFAVFRGLIWLGRFHHLHRNPDLEVRAFAHLRLDVDLAIEQADETFDDRHAVATAFGELIVGLDAHKWLEHLFQLVLRDTDACVDDVEDDQPASQPRLEADAAFQGVFDAIGDEVGKYLSDLQFVGVKDGVGRYAVFEMERQVLVFGDGRKHLGDFLAKLPDGEGLLADLQLALFEAGVFQ